MGFIDLSDVEQLEPVPGFRGHFVHSDNMTVAHWTIEADARLPEHSHPHEQVANVVAGEFELTVDGKTRILGPGTVALIPSNIPHSGRAITQCRIIDVFHPVREDYGPRP